MRRTNIKTTILAALAHFALGMGGSAIAQPAPNDLPPVRFELDHHDGKYRENDTVRVTIEADVEAFVYVIYHQASGDAVVLFPNNSDRENRMVANGRKVLPSTDRVGDKQRTMRIRISAPFGDEAVQVLSSYRPIGELERAVDNAREGVPEVNVKEIEQLSEHYAVRNALIANDIMPIKTMPRGYNRK